MSTCAMAFLLCRWSNTNKSNVNKSNLLLCDPEVVLGGLLSTMIGNAEVDLMSLTAPPKLQGMPMRAMDLGSFLQCDVALREHMSTTRGHFLDASGAPL